jgi:hypothetical protein
MRTMMMISSSCDREIYTSPFKRSYARDTIDAGAELFDEVAPVVLAVGRQSLVVVERVAERRELLEGRPGRDGDLVEEGDRAEIVDVRGGARLDGATEPRDHESAVAERDLERAHRDDDSLGEGPAHLDAVCARDGRLGGLEGNQVARVENAIREDGPARDGGDGRITVFTPTRAFSRPGRRLAHGAELATPAGRMPDAAQR